MKAIVYHSYGSPDVLKCEEIEKQTAGDDEVVIKAHAASVNPLDKMIKGRPLPRSRTDRPAQAKAHTSRR
jgi:NADPH:quinone reductase-like Zn-dependent oxidoreductase